MARPALRTVADLLQQLALDGPTGAAALRGALKVSSQTLTRLAAAARDDVIRFGRGPSTQYARTRAVEGLGRTIPAFQVSEAGELRPNGTLHLLWGSQTLWERGRVTLPFRGLPPALVDMAPQGYLGWNFSARYSELRLPPRLNDWSDDHRLVALARRGDDCVGDLIIGDESLQRFLDASPVDVAPDEFPRLANRSATETVGSSAGGERPKFGVFSRGRHVLVKFAKDAANDVARRWRDLLWCEWRALETVADAGRAAPRARYFDSGGWRFLEVERFDRVGGRGRRAVASLAVLNNEYLGTPSTWTAAAPLLRAPPFLLSDADASHLRWLDAFGQLIGNNDRHFGNVSFFVSDDGALRLAPTYDMLPMVLAPSAEVVVARPPDPSPPTSANLDVWLDAATWATRFWTTVRDQAELEGGIRAHAEAAMTAIDALVSRVRPDRQVVAAAT